MFMLKSRVDKLLKEEGQRMYEDGLEAGRLAGKLEEREDFCNFIDQSLDKKLIHWRGFRYSTVKRDSNGQFAQD